MKRLGTPVALALVCALCVTLTALPLHADEAKKVEQTKKRTAAEPSAKPAEDSKLVKASREVERERRGDAKSYSNDDLVEDSASGAVVITNDDLTRMFGASETREPATPSGPGDPAAQPADLPDPLAMIEQEKKAQAERESEVAQAKSELAAARQKLANLEKQLLATRNPFSARPKLSEEEQERRAAQQETAAERNERTQKLVEEARAEVAEAEANLARVGGR
jgi:hypothetical protein